MNALEILRSILNDGHLSETNRHRAQRLLDEADADPPVDLHALLQKCRQEARSASPTQAINRYRLAAQCSLVAAHDAVINPREV